MIYTIIFAGLFFIAFIAATCKTRCKQLETGIYIACSILLLLLAAFRYKTGFDWYGYEDLYTRIKQNGGSLFETILNTNVEPTYTLIAYISSTYRETIVIFACLGVLVKCIFFFKQKEKFLYLFMYYSTIFVNYDMGVIRQGVAIGIVFCGIHYINKRKFKKYLTMVILASCFHMSSIVALPLYFISNKQFSRKFYYISLLVISVVFSNSFFEIIYSISSKVGLTYISDRLAYYLFYTANSEEMITLATLAKRTLFLVVFVEFYKSRKYKGEVWTYINGYFLSLFLMLLLQSYPILAGRGMAVLYFMQIFVFCDMVHKSCTIMGKSLILLLILALNFNSMNGVILSEFGDYIPYQSAFFQ